MKLSTKIVILDKISEGKSVKKFVKYYKNFCLCYLSKIKQTREMAKNSKVAIIVCLQRSRNHGTSKMELFVITVNSLNIVDFPGSIYVPQ